MSLKKSLLRGISVFLSCASVVYVTSRHGRFSFSLLSDLADAYRNGVLDRRRFFACGLPLSDPKAVNFGQVRGWRAVHFVRKDTVIPPTELRNVFEPILYVVGLGTLKRMGALKVVNFICDSIITRGKNGAIQAIALSTKADLDMLNYRFSRAADDEKHLMLLGTINAPITVQSRFYLDAHPKLEELERAENALRKAIDMSPNWPFLKYQLACLLLERSEIDAALSIFEEFIGSGNKWRFFEHDFIAYSLVRSFSRVTSQSSASKTQNPTFQEDLESTFKQKFRPRTWERDNWSEFYSICPVSILSTEEIRTHLHSEISAFWPKQSLLLRYHVFHSKKIHIEVEKKIDVSEVYLLCPRSLLMQAGGWPSFVINKQYTVNSMSAYDGAQFGIFDRHMLAVNGVAGLRTVHPCPTYIAEKTIVLWGYSDNYYHFIFDCLGSLAFYSPDQIRNAERIIISGFKENLAPFQLALAELVDHSIVEKLLKIHDGAPDINLSDSCFCTNPNTLNVPHPRVVDFLRQRLMRKESTKERRVNLFVGRSDRRRIEQEKYQNLFAFLETNDFEYVDPGKMSVIEQREVFSRAGVIVFEAGAAVSNLLFCPQDSHAILLTSEFGYRDIFAALAAALGIEFSVVLSPNVKFYPRAFLCWSEVWLDIDETSALMAIQNAVASYLNNLARSEKNER